MVLKIVYDNTSCRSDLQSDWGFAAVVGTGKRQILFDAGADGAILLDNMAKMEIDPAKIDTVFISHHHFDHTGGLAAFLARNRHVTVYVPNSLRGVRRADEVIQVAESCRLTDDLFSTGELGGIEQSLIGMTPDGVILVVGCAHPGLAVMMEAASQYGPIAAIAGGFHHFQDLHLLKNIRKICPTHCTRAVKQIQAVFPDQFIPGGVGRIFEL